MKTDTRIAPSTRTNQVPFEIGSRSASSAGPTLKSEIAKPIAIRNANTIAPRESSVSASSFSSAAA